ncbi:MAG: hypothetical protein F6K47_18470 [Symploca sp. SIO2E6]|nr:hypothetical protein [Symploca sp. SIO2E6]
MSLISRDQKIRLSKINTIWQQIKSSDRTNIVCRTHIRGTGILPVPETIAT